MGRGAALSLWVSTAAWLPLLWAAGCVRARAVAAGAKIYWSLNWPHKIQRSNLDGTEVEDIHSEISYPTGLAADLAGGKLYWSEEGQLTDSIKRSNFDGSDVEVLLDGYLSWGMAIDAAGGKLYWSNMNAGKIQRSNLDGTGVEDLVAEGLAGPAGLALDVERGHVYWCDHTAQRVQRCRLDGSGVETLVSGLSFPQGLALDTKRGRLYWTDSGTFKIQRAALDGSGLEDLAMAELKDPYSIAVDSESGLLYWSAVGTHYDRRKGTSEDSTNGRIQRSDLNGSHVVDLVLTGRRKAFSIALVPNPASSSGPGSSSPIAATVCSDASDACGLPVD